MFASFDIKNQLNKVLFSFVLFSHRDGQTFAYSCMGFPFYMPPSKVKFVAKWQNIDLLPNHQNYFRNCNWVHKLSLKGRYEICRSLFVTYKPIILFFFFKVSWNYVSLPQNNEKISYTRNVKYEKWETEYDHSAVGFIFNAFKEPFEKIFFAYTTLIYITLTICLHYFICIQIVLWTCYTAINQSYTWVIMHTCSNLQCPLEPDI